jgi:hypothetical protein
MKFKARDIISGWPRGRSTSCPNVPETGGWWFLTFGRASWKEGDISLLYFERQMVAHYHEQQAEMMDDVYHQVDDYATRLFNAMLADISLGKN